MAESSKKTIAKAYIQIIPSAEGISDALGKLPLGDGADKAGRSAGSRIASAAAGAIRIGGAAIAAALGAAVTGAAAIGTAAVKSYAQYEQLVGGVETLFGAGGKSVEEYAKSVSKSVGEVQGEYDALMKAQNTVMKNAHNAYASAGMSANQYMENVTSFAASLTQSLEGDTVVAAELADVALTDMSDNANKIGTDMERITDAYQGFAKQNYTINNLMSAA